MKILIKNCLILDTFDIIVKVKLVIQRKLSQYKRYVKAAFKPKIPIILELQGSFGCLPEITLSNPGRGAI